MIDQALSVRVSLDLEAARYEFMRVMTQREAGLKDAIDKAIASAMENVNVERYIDSEATRLVNAEIRVRVRQRVERAVRERLDSPGVKATIERAVTAAMAEKAAEVAG